MRVELLRDHKQTGLCLQQHCGKAFRIERLARKFLGVLILAFYGLTQELEHDILGDAPGLIGEVRGPPPPVPKHPFSKGMTKSHILTPGGDEALGVVAVVKSESEQIRVLAAYGGVIVGRAAIEQLLGIADQALGGFDYSRIQAAS